MTCKCVAQNLVLPQRDSDGDILVFCVFETHEYCGDVLISIYANEDDADAYVKKAGGRYRVEDFPLR